MFDFYVLSMNLLEIMTLIFIFIFDIGSQSFIVLGKDQKCQRAQDCAPSCQLGIPSCSDGICGCIEGIRRSVSFKKDNIYLGKCSCGCKPHCVLGFCTCPCCWKQKLRHVWG